MTVETFERVAERFGVPAALLLLFCGAAWYVLVRCFSEKNGLFPKLVTKQVDMMDRLSSTNETLTEHIGTVKDCLITLTESTGKRDEEHATLLREIHTGVRHLCKD